MNNNFSFVFADICSQKRDSGICPGNVPRFYFDKSLARCQLFSYGGCGGNSNNFETLDQCVAHCGGPKEDVFQISTLTDSLKPRKSHCNLPVSKGNCQAKLRRFHFDPDEGICKLFIFGGCTGNLVIFCKNGQVLTFVVIYRQCQQL